MLQRFSTLGRRLSAAFTEDDLIALVGNARLIKVGNTWRIEHPPNLAQVAFQAALAAAGNMVVYTVTAGNLPVIYGISFSGSVAGRYILFVGAVAVAESAVPANGNYVLTLANPWVGAVTGPVIALQNQSGAASDVTATAILSEYTP